MRPANFSLHQPSSVSEAAAAIASGGTPLAGGQSLVQAMRLRTESPTDLVDLANVDDLSNGIELISDSDDRSVLRIGARVTHQQLIENDLVRKNLPWLIEAGKALGDVQVRQLGTIVGNICWADPRANFAVAALASNATVNIVVCDQPGSIIRKPIDSFYVGFKQTSLRNELVASIDIPVISAVGSYTEFSRQPQDLAIVNVCVVRGGDNQGSRIAVGGIHETPVRLSRAEEELNQTGIVDFQRLEQAIDSTVAEQQFAPPKEYFASSAYKFELAKTLTVRAVRQLGN